MSCEVCKTQMNVFVFMKVLLMGRKCLENVNILMLLLMQIVSFSSFSFSVSFCLGLWNFIKT